MNTILFVVHRPYHLFVSINRAITLKKSKPGLNIILSLFHTPDNYLNSYSKSNDYSYLFKLNHVFDEVIKHSRTGEQQIYNFIGFRKYYDSKAQEFEERYKAYRVSEIYVFSDKEKPVEILAFLLKKKNKAEVILLDEGLVSYKRNRQRIFNVFKKILIHLLNYQLLSETVYYGESRIVDRFEALLPELCTVKRKGIEKADALDIDSITQYLNFDPLLNSVIYVSNLVTNLYKVEHEDENKLILILASRAKQNGCKFYIKPHPVENVDRYTKLGVDVLNKNMPVESFYNKTNIFLSFKSSSLMTAALHNQRSFDLCQLLNIKNDIKMFQKIGVKRISTFEQINRIFD